MPLHMLPATPASKTSTVGSFLNSFIHEDLPTFALWAGLMAVIWIACAAITVAGAVIGIAVVTTFQELTQSWSFSRRRRSEVEDDELIIADTGHPADDAQATIIDLDHYRQRREHHQSADAVDVARGDDPA